MDDETLIHLMYDRALARNVWRFPIPIPDPNLISFAIWAMEIYEQLSNHHMCLFITYCWRIWGARNEKVWKNCTPKGTMIVEKSRRCFSVWEEANE